MRLLLDTHAALWAIADPEALSEEARAAIVDGQSIVLLSAASSWEVAIRRRLGKLVFEGDLQALGEQHRFTPLPITHEHAAAVEKLPPLHRDPFDRLLVAQALAEGATLVTRDAAVAAYDVPTLRC